MFKAYKGRVVDASRPVRLYRNLTLVGKWYSVVQDGKVVAHVTALRLYDCRFVVSRKGRDRVRRERKKYVHAYIEGSLLGSFDRRNRFNEGLISYNPFEDEGFRFTCTMHVSASTFVTEASVVDVKAEAIFAINAIAGV